MTDGRWHAKDVQLCIISLRGAFPHASRCCGYEFEDVICDVEGVQPLVPQARLSRLGQSPWTKSLLRRLPWELVPRPRLAPLTVDRPYDAAFVLVQSVADLQQLRAVRDWRQRCGLAIAYVEEVWKGWIEKYSHPRSPVHLLREFDYIFVNCRGSVEALRQVTGRPVHYMPPGVDALRFAPSSAHRCIDVFNMGRRSAVTHEALMRLAETRPLHYVFDSFSGDRVLHVQHHRRLLANLLKRTRYFIVQPAKVNREDHTRGQQELGFRYFEGAAAGAVMIGQAPDVASFQENFDWPDTIVPMAFDCPEIGSLLQQWDRQTERLATIRHQNVLQSLRRHDWLHRWKEIGRIAGLPLGGQSDTRQNLLQRSEERVNEIYHPMAVARD